MLTLPQGAWAARYLAKIVEIAGLPKNGDEKFFHDLYKACDSGSIFNKTTKNLFKGYECQSKPAPSHSPPVQYLVLLDAGWQDVKISALCCFDTVGSLGLPLTGLAKPLAVLQMGKKKKPDMVSDVASSKR